MENLIATFTLDDHETIGRVVKLERHSFVLELSASDCPLFVSQVFNDLQIRVGDEPLFFGRAVVVKLIEVKPTTFCELSIDDGWQHGSSVFRTSDIPLVRCEFAKFMAAWGRAWAVHPDFKIVISDLVAFLAEAREWLEQVEARLRFTEETGGLMKEREVVEALAPGMEETLKALFGRFEIVAAEVAPSVRPTHEAFARKQVLPLLKASPFVNRTHTKPLGYAGDYEMVNMMTRDPAEGKSFFGKLINIYALGLTPVVAHRNRIRHLLNVLVNEALRASRTARRLRVLNLGCGPAREIYRFLEEHELSNSVDFQLFDFNSETVQHVVGVLSEVRSRCGRHGAVIVEKRSVNQLLKQAIKTPQITEQYDFIYCAGLYDYISDSVCQSLNDYLYRLLAPDGLLLFTNVNAHSSRFQMEYFLEWHLIYRNAAELTALAPKAADSDELTLRSEDTGANLLVTIRKRH